MSTKVPGQQLETETLEQIRETYEAEGYILDPHTAIGVRVARAVL